MAENYFGPHIAEIYDTRWANLSEPSVPDPAVSFLAGLAGTGSALEFGIGTGRVALPLSRRGVRVHGIELSADMAAQLQAKPGAEAIGVTIGDFAAARADGTFGLAYLLRNTIMNLTTQDAQVACFQNAARHLEPGGRFSILLPFHRTVYLEKLAAANGFFLQEKLLIRQTPAHEPFRSVLLFSGTEPGSVSMQELTIRDENGQETADLLSLLRDYYLTRGKG